MMRLGLVLLTKNEVEGLTALFDRLPLAAFDEVLAVDAGSTDGTRELLAARGVRVVDQDRRGRGEAFKAAFKASAADALVFFSPDGNEDPADLPRFRAELASGAGLVIASRMMAGARNEEDGEVLRLRKRANLAFTWLANAFFNRGAYVTDTINGFRAVTRAAWDAAAPDASGFDIEFQLTMRAMKRGLRIVEFPTSEGPRIGGTSTASSVPTGLRFLRTLAGELLAR